MILEKFHPKTVLAFTWKLKLARFIAILYLLMHFLFMFYTLPCLIVGGIIWEQQKFFLEFLRWGRNQNKMTLWSNRNLALKLGRRFLIECVCACLCVCCVCVVCVDFQIYFLC